MTCLREPKSTTNFHSKDNRFKDKYFRKKWRSSMDKVVKIKPSKSLQFSDDKSRGGFTIENRGERPLAYKIRLSVLGVYSLKPNTGILSAGDSQDVSIGLIDPNYRSNSELPDKLQLQAIEVNDLKMSRSEFDRKFKCAKPGLLFERVMLCKFHGSRSKIRVTDEANEETDADNKVIPKTSSLRMLRQMIMEDINGLRESVGHIGSSVTCAQESLARSEARLNFMNRVQYAVCSFLAILVIGFASLLAIGGTPIYVTYVHAEPFDLRPTFSFDSAV